jgi:hypothetical protein
MPEFDSPEFDINKPSVARIYDFLLGGKDNFAADREAGEEIKRAVPGVEEWATENRLFLAKAIHYLASAGIRQFIDIGSGLPTVQNTHEVAHAAAPEARIVYVDYDPQVITHARALLAAGENVYALEGDIRDPEAVMGAIGESYLNFSQPVGILLVAILHFIDDQTAYPVVQQLMSYAAPGSYLVVGHGSYDHVSQEQADAVRSVYREASEPAYPRSKENVTRFFSGLEITAHGVTGVGAWGSPAGSDNALGYAGVGLKHGAAGA